MNNLFQAYICECLCTELIGSFCGYRLPIWHGHVICLNCDGFQIFYLALQEGCKPVFELQSGLVKYLAVFHFLMFEAAIHVVNIDKAWRFRGHQHRSEENVD